MSDKTKDMLQMIKTLGDGYFPKVIEETGAISIGTSLLSGGKDGLEVYLIPQEDSTMFLTDGGDTFASAVYDYPLSHGDFIDDILKGYPKVKLYGREVACKTQKETFVHDFYIYVSAIMHLVGFFEYGSEYAEWREECAPSLIPWQLEEDDE